MIPMVEAKNKDSPFSPNIKYGVLGKFTTLALKFFEFEESDIYHGLRHFNTLLKKRYKQKCKQFHPDTAQIRNHPNYKGTVFRDMLRMYSRLRNINSLPIPLDKADIFFELESDLTPDLGLDRNEWISKKRFISWA